MYANAKNWIKAFCKNEQGISAVEYGISGAFLGAIIIVSMWQLAPQISTRLDDSFDPAKVLSGPCGKIKEGGSCGKKKSV